MSLLYLQFQRDAAQFVPKEYRTSLPEPRSQVNYLLIPGPSRQLAAQYMQLGQCCQFVITGSSACIHNLCDYAAANKALILPRTVSFAVATFSSPSDADLEPEAREKHKLLTRYENTAVTPQAERVSS